MKKKKFLSTVIWVCLFAIAMGYLESAVVVYIRALYYPEGFNFPMKLISDQILETEFFREAATMVMLVGIAVIAGKKPVERFAYFILSFGVWDIFYYVFLYSLLGWPQSLFTWDILFFIPVTWVGPLLPPLTHSAMMILLAFTLMYFFVRNKKTKTGPLVWSLLISGSLVVIVSYTMDFVCFMLPEFSIWEVMGAGDTQKMLSYATTYIPRHFNWWLFFCGTMLHVFSICLIIRKNRRAFIKNMVSE